jgi:hypothetical protein
MKPTTPPPPPRPLRAESSSSSSAASSTSTAAKRKIFVENLEWNVHENLLKNVFKKFGVIKRCKIVRDSQTNKSRGYGYVEFAFEADVEGLFASDLSELTIKERLVKCVRFKEKEKKKHKNRVLPTSDVAAAAETVVVDDGSSSSSSSSVEMKRLNQLVNELPYNVLVKIFSYLCLRDRCVVEQVCTRWYEISKIAWSQMRKVVIDTKNIYENYEPKSKNQHGFKAKPVFDTKALTSILRKNVGKNLNNLDLSENAHNFGLTLMPMIIAECASLVYLNLSKLNISNFNLGRLIKRSQTLKELNIAHCIQISDSSIIRLFNYCKDLEKLNVTFCSLIRGKCFEGKAKAEKLVHLVIDGCENITDSSLLNLFGYNKNFTHLSMKRTKPYSSDVILCVINHLNKLETLLLTDIGLSSLIGLDVSLIKFENLTALHKLDLANSNGDNKLVSSLLNKCASLQWLNISYCLKITDETFTSATIKSQLQELNLSYINHITDLTIESLSQIRNSLKVLKLKGCANITNDGVCKIISESPNLIYLDVRSNNLINNEILETALLMDRKIHILCEDTKVNPVEFCYKYDSTNKKLTERNYYIFSYKNLTFETSMPKKIENWTTAATTTALVDADCEVYFLDEDGDDLVEDNNSYSEFFDDHEDFEDYDDDDMDFLDNDGETEMLNEFDTR